MKPRDQGLFWSLAHSRKEEKQKCYTQRGWHVGSGWERWGGEERLSKKE